MSSVYRTIGGFSAHAKATVGDTKTSVVPNDHMGWLKCDGRSLSTTDFHLLWRVIGYSFGGSGSAFNLPDAGGKIVGIVGQGTDISGNDTEFVLGEEQGEYTHTLTIPEIPSHSHTGTTDSAGTHA